MTAPTPAALAEVSRAALFMRRLVKRHGPGARDVLEASLARMTPSELAALLYHWAFWARPKQVFPNDAWRVLLILAGRGWGKTRAINEFLNQEVREQRVERFLIIGRTDDEAERVIVRGKDSGLLAISPPWFKPRAFKGEPKSVLYPNGAVGYLASAEKPDSVRGENLDLVIWDEFASARPELAREVHYNARMALRGSARARLVMATTSRLRRPMIKEIRDKARKDPRYRIIQGGTLENRGNLPPDYVQDLIEEYRGTRLWSQELEGNVLDEDDFEGAIWSGKWFVRADAAPELVRVVVAVDPAVSVRQGSDETGIVVAGIGADGLVYVLADESGRYSPDKWPKMVMQLARRFRAGAVVVETNRGGNLATQALLAARHEAGLVDLAVKEVRAEHAKETRADPVARLYERGRVVHVGSDLGKLEDQMVTWDPRKEKSPDRIDALVWAVWDLAGRPDGFAGFEEANRMAAPAGPVIGELSDSPFDDDDGDWRGLTIG
jgi:phage terminase large subunit-like protein